MSIKVNRHKIAEEYNTTSDWLSSHLNTRYSSTEKFATIEEKMEDIKFRVGFDKVNGIGKTAGCGCEGECKSCAASCSCGTCEVCMNNKCDCGTCEVCISRSGLSEVAILKSYIKDIVSDPRVENNVSNIISKCEKNDSISSILSKVKNQALLIDYIKDLCSKVSKDMKIDRESSVYMPLDEAHSMGDIEENEPAYVSYGDRS